MIIFNMERNSWLHVMSAKELHLFTLEGTVLFGLFSLEMTAYVLLTVHHLGHRAIIRETWNICQELEVTRSLSLNYAL